MIEHIVLIKFLPETTFEQKQELIFKTFQLKSIIPGILDLQQGFNFSERSEGYEVGLTVRFKDKVSLENYGPHPAHKEVVAYLNNIGLDQTLIFDFEF